MSTFELRARCPRCRSVRVLAGPFRANSPAELDRAEWDMDRAGSWEAHYPACDAVEDVAAFWDGTQTEPWCNAIEYEARGGPTAGPLPPKPWPETN